MQIKAQRRVFVFFPSFIKISSFSQEKFFWLTLLSFRTANILPHLSIYTNEGRIHIKITCKYLITLKAYFYSKVDLCAGSPLLSSSFSNFHDFFSQRFAGFYEICWKYLIKNIVNFHNWHPRSLFPDFEHLNSFKTVTSSKQLTPCKAT